MNKNTAIVINNPIKLIELKNIVYSYDDLIKGVVDIESCKIAMGGEWHSDSEALLIEAGSNSKDLWGFNMYFEDYKLEYHSMINIKPAFGYKKMEIEDEVVISKVNEIIKQYLL